MVSTLQYEISAPVFLLHGVHSAVWNKRPSLFIVFNLFVFYISQNCTFVLKCTWSLWWIDCCFYFGKTYVWCNCSLHYLNDNYAFNFSFNFVIYNLILHFLIFIKCCLFLYNNLLLTISFHIRAQFVSFIVLV